MMLILFFLLLLAVMLAWIGRRRPAIYVFIAMQIAAALIFVCDLNTKLMLQL